MSKKLMYYQTALEECKNSGHTIRHGCVIVKGGKIIGKIANRNFHHAEEGLISRCLLQGIQT